MPKKRFKVYNNQVFSNTGERVVLTHHVVKRVRERRAEFKNKSDFNIRKTLIHEISNSRLIGIEGGEEHRNYHGHIYACVRENGKLIAKTYLHSSSSRKRNDFLERKVS